MSPELLSLSRARLHAARESVRDLISSDAVVATALAELCDAVGYLIDANTAPCAPSSSDPLFDGDRGEAYWLARAEGGDYR